MGRKAVVNVYPQTSLLALALVHADLDPHGLASIRYRCIVLRSRLAEGCNQRCCVVRAVGPVAGLEFLAGLQGPIPIGGLGCWPRWPALAAYRLSSEG